MWCVSDVFVVWYVCAHVTCVMCVACVNNVYTWGVCCMVH